MTSWIQKIREQPQKKRIRILMVTVVAFMILLIGFWIVIGDYNPGSKADTSFFKTIGSSVKNFAGQNFNQQFQQAQQDAQRKVQQQTQQK